MTTLINTTLSWIHVSMTSWAGEPRSGVSLVDPDSYSFVNRPWNEQKLVGEIRARILESWHFVPLVPFASASCGPLYGNGPEERFLNVIQAIKELLEQKAWRANALFSLEGKKTKWSFSVLECKKSGAGKDRIYMVFSPYSGTKIKGTHWVHKWWSEPANFRPVIHSEH